MLHPEIRHVLANAIQVLEAMAALNDLTPEEFLKALKETAARLRWALEKGEEKAA